MQSTSTFDELELLTEELAQTRAELGRFREAARRSDQRLSLALQAFDSVVWEMSFVDRRLFATGAVAAIYDAPPSYKAFSEDILVACHPLDRERVGALWDAHLAHGRPFRTEYRINRRDGREVWVDAAAETLRDEAGAPERVIGVIKNITRQKHDQLAVARAREAAEAANKAKSEFLANMSHEIRTPLNGMMGVAGALARTRLNREQREMVELIERSAHTLERLLTDILDLARIESGRLEIKDEPFDMHLLLQEVAALFETRAKEKGLAFFLDVDAAGAGWASGDHVRLRQILSNLLSNAVKFTSEGVVRLSAEAEPVRDGHQRIVFKVEDTGIGFDADAAARLFGRFNQADGSITRRYGGSGLGLSISRSLAERMGGRLEASSEPGKGACFTLTLELAVALAGAAPAPQGTSPVIPSLGGVRGAPIILLAEDHPTNRRVVELILGAAGAVIVNAENGLEAVRAAAAQDFDLILMDMQMPVMDGLTAIRAIRDRERAAGTRRTPILTLSANAMAEHTRASREAGADGHITKPVSAQALLETVGEAIGAGVSLVLPSAAASA